jgi:hypothetical protein
MITKMLKMIKFLVELRLLLLYKDKNGISFETINY